MIRGIIFDCFGVLYTDASKAYFSRFPDLQEKLYDVNKLSDHGFIDRSEYIAQVAKITGVGKEETETAFMHEFVVNKPLIEYIRTKLKPYYKVGLLSNIGRDWMQDFFDEHQLHDLFDVAVLSHEEGIAKPNPLIFERTATRLGLLPEDCVMIDDREENCQGAASIDMKMHHYTDNESLWAALNQLEIGEHHAN